MKRIWFLSLSFILGITLVFLFSLILNQAVSMAVFANSNEEEYQLINLGTLGGDQSKANDLNLYGEIVGNSSLEAGEDQTSAFLWKNGTLKPLTQFHSGNTEAFAINNQGIIAGSIISKGLTTTQQLPVVWTNDTFSILETIDDTGGVAADINNFGIIAGHSISESENHLILWEGDAISITIPFNDGLGNVTALNDLNEVAGFQESETGENHAFFWTADGFVPLGTLGGSDSWAYDINANSQIVGSSTISDDLTLHAFLWQEGTMTDLGSKDNISAASSIANGINDQGVIVGQAQVGDEENAVMWVDGELIDLNELLPEDSEFDHLISAQSINNEGWIVGSGLIDGAERAFLMHPEEISIIYLPIIRKPADPPTPTPTPTKPPTPSPTPTSTPVPSGSMDMLPFMRSSSQPYEMQHSDGPRTRHQTQTEVVKFFYVKGENTGEWEELWADKSYIYRGTDTSPGVGISGEEEFYTLYQDPTHFLNGIPGDEWNPRYWKVGETYFRNPYVVFFRKSNCEVIASGYLPTAFIHETILKFEAYHPRYTFETGVTLNDVVQFAWLENGRPIERWWFAKGFGLVSWWGNGRFSSSIAEIHAPGARPDIPREVIPCLDKEEYRQQLNESDLNLGPLPEEYARKVK